MKKPESSNVTRSRSSFKHKRGPSSSPAPGNFFFFSLNNHLVIKDSFQVSITMPHHDFPVNPKAHEARAAATYLARDINSLELSEINLQHLGKLKIRVESMELDEKSPQRPIYFTPFSDPSVRDVKRDDLSQTYNGEDDEREGWSLTDPYYRSYQWYYHFQSHIAHFQWKAKHTMAPSRGGE